MSSIFDILTSIFHCSIDISRIIFNLLKLCIAVGAESIEKIKKKRKENLQKDEAFKRLKEDIETIDDDHLDINLLQEETFLKQYLSLLEK